MPLFRKKTTLVHHITYMGLMAAINIIFIALATINPVLMLLLILLLPFASAIVAYYCLKRYYPIYALATIGLCLIFRNFADTLFYVVPAIASGFVIGLLLEKKIHPFWMVLFTTLINAGLSYAFIPLVNYISGTDIIHTLLVILRLDGYTYCNEIGLLLIFIISLMQSILTHFILLSDIKKMGIEVNTRVDSFGPYIIGLEASVILSIGFAFFYFPLTLVFMAISFCFAGFLAYDQLCSKRTVVYIMFGSAVFLAIILFAIFYQMIEKPYGITLTLLFPLVISVTSFVKNYLLKGALNN